MNLKRLTLEEYQKRKAKSYLEKCLKNGTAEYYIINYNDEEYQFFFYKKPEDTADLCVDQHAPKSLFDYKDVMNEIFAFLKEKGYKKVEITLMDNFDERKALALKYGFKEIQKYKQGISQFVDYCKEL